MRIVLITGMSGSGKSVALRLLEDLGDYCVDNLPPRLLASLTEYLSEAGHSEVAVSIDARSESSLAGLPQLLSQLRETGHDLRLLFLTASTEALVQRYSETRRRHPLSERLARGAGLTEPTLEESIAAERELLAPLEHLGHVIDTGGVAPNTLRQWVRQFVDHPPATLTLAFESFAFKNGVPVAADLLFDVRNLPNPFYEPHLKALTGFDPEVAAYLAAVPIVGEMIGDIEGFIDRWLPSYKADSRNYVTVAIGCTGGQHRSVYVVEQLAERFRRKGSERVLRRHRTLAR